MYQDKFSPNHLLHTSISQVRLVYQGAPKGIDYCTQLVCDLKEDQLLGKMGVAYGWDQFLDEEMDEFMFEFEGEDF